MTEQPTPPESASQSEQKLKALIIQGILGAIALAGTTAIPLVVTQLLQGPTTPVAAPSVAPAAEVMPATSPVQVEGMVPVTETSERSDDGKNKPKKKD